MNYLLVAWQFIIEYSSYVIPVVIGIIAFLIGKNGSVRETYSHIFSVFIAISSAIRNLYEDFSSFIGKANSESPGNPSSMRVNVFFALSQWSIAITFGFIWVLLYHPEFIIEYLGVLAALVGGLLGLKMWQKKNEGPADPQPGQVAGQ